MNPSPLDTPANQALLVFTILALVFDFMGAYGYKIPDSPLKLWVLTRKFWFQGVAAALGGVIGIICCLPQAGIS